jgi:hypothetical protein
MRDDTTQEYAIETAKVLLNPFTQQATGSLTSPDGDSAVRLYTAKGGSAITLNTSTTSCVLVFDPEASIRNGRLRVIAYERNAANAIIGQQIVFMGRDSADFLAAGIVSSGLKLFNSSGVDTIGGTQTAAVLNSVPRDVSLLTSSDVSNFSSNHARDLAFGVVSRDDATMTVSITEHFGAKKCLSRTNTLSNVVRRDWDDSLGTRSTTSGSSFSPIADFTVNIVGTEMTVAQALANLKSDNTAATDTQIPFDTNRLSDANNPLTLATYAADMTLSLQPGANTSIATDNARFKGKFVAFDAFNVELATASVQHDPSATGGTPDRMETFHFAGSLVSTTSPIHRIIFILTQFENGTVADVVFTATGTTMHMMAHEETADIPGRPIHVAVFEGLNAGATINVSSSAVISGVPDSANVFIGSYNNEQDDVYDLNATHMFLRSVASVMPRAFTVAGHGKLESEITAYYGGDEVRLAFRALSFAKVGRAIKRAGKKVAKATTSAIKAATPVMRQAAAAMAPVPIPQVQAAAIGLRAGADLGESFSRGDAKGSFRASRRLAGSKKEGRKQAAMMGYEYATGEEFPDEYADYADMM